MVHDVTQRTGLELPSDERGANRTGDHARPGEAPLREAHSGGTAPWAGGVQGAGHGRLREALRHDAGADPDRARSGPHPPISPEWHPRHPQRLCLRSDLHRLLDKGNLTIDPDDRKIVVSRRIKDEYDNGEDYYPLHGRPLTPLVNPAAMPSREYLLFHAEHVFR
jgi:hypothetical protein